LVIGYWLLVIGFKKKNDLNDEMTNDEMTNDEMTPMAK
jgi:hypothetical protein